MPAKPMSTAIATIRAWWIRALMLIGIWLISGTAHAQAPSPPGPESWAIHAQSTFTFQYHPAFPGAYTNGQKTFVNGSRGSEDSNSSISLGLRVWRGGELWVETEIDQGFGLSNSQGIAGFTDGNSFKLSQTAPFWRLPRAFFRQTFGLGGDSQKIDPDMNVLGGTRDANRIVVTVGKFGVNDVFDQNTFASDPRADFLNWMYNDAGAFDYATDPFGMTYGIAIEWYQNWCALRAGLFDMAVSPEAQFLDMRFIHQVQAVFEAEERHNIMGRAGKLSLLVFANRGLMIKLSDFTNAVAATGIVPTMASLRHFRTRVGISLNLEQSLTDSLGLFSRLSWADGGLEVLNFTDVDRSATVGLSLKGQGWNRPNDLVGTAFAFNEISRDRLNFLRAGGLGGVIGDGAGFPARAGGEHIFETFYNLSITKWLNATVDYQLVNHPAYNVERGPVHVFGIRLHAQI